jgi:hypothetical protein
MPALAEVISSGKATRNAFILFSRSFLNEYHLFLITTISEEEYFHAENGGKK